MPKTAWQKYCTDGCKVKFNNALRKKEMAATIVRLSKAAKEYIRDGKA